MQKWLTTAAANLTGDDDWVFYFGVYFLGTLITGIGMAKLIEYPFLKLRNKYFPTLSPPLMPDAKT